jgi:hypothetical protein
MNSIIKTHYHSNYDVLKEFSESSGTLLYKGSPIIAKSTHENLSVITEAGVHGLRYYNNKLQYYGNSKWNDIATGGGGGTVAKDIVISLTANNALKKYSNGYFVQEFLISKQANNALVKYSDGYYVPKIPVNNATLDDVTDAKEELEDIIAENVDNINQKYYTLTQKVSEIASNTTKSKTHKYSGGSDTLKEVVIISNLYNEANDVILKMELMIKNKSDKNPLVLQTLENNIETMNITLNPEEVQKYVLTNTPHIAINVQGSYEMYLYVQYV